MRSALCALLRAIHSARFLPRFPVEPTLVQLKIHHASLVKCAILAPIGVQAHHARVENIPRGARRGQNVQFELLLSDYPCVHETELKVAIASLALHVRIDAVFHRSSHSQPVRVPVMMDLEREPTHATHLLCGTVSVSIAIPIDVKRDAERDAVLVIHRITLGRHAVPLPQAISLPLCLPCVVSMHAPLSNMHVETCGWLDFAIGPDGTLYVSLSGRDLRVFSACGFGSPLSDFTLGDKVDNMRSRSVAVCAATNTLLFANSNYAWNMVAINMSSRAVRWVLKSMAGCCNSIGVLPTQGLVVFNNCQNKTDDLRVHRLTDGTFVTRTNSFARLICSIAVDPVSAVVYCNVANNYGDVNSVFAYVWSGIGLVEDEYVHAAGTSRTTFLLSVVPPGPGQHTSFLVAAKNQSSILRVFSLPDRRLVHTHTLANNEIVGLTADPSGTALAVCDKTSEAIHVLPWPLPGMSPPL